MTNGATSRIWKREETKNTAYFIFKYIKAASEKDQISLKRCKDPSEMKLLVDVYMGGDRTNIHFTLKLQGPPIESVVKEVPLKSEIHIEKPDPDMVPKIDLQNTPVQPLRVRKFS